LKDQEKTLFISRDSTRL